MNRTKTKKPDWLKIQMPGGSRYKKIRNTVSQKGLHTVCQEARCPNIGECWNSGTATFMILGDRCTRGCQFCAVQTGNPKGVVDGDEPTRVANGAFDMELDYVVVTSVTRDDLPDGGASIFAEVTEAIKALPSSPKVELLTPDYIDDDLDIVLNAGPTVFAHNVEVVERLSKTMRHHRFSYTRSLHCLEQAAAHTSSAITKSSLMIGLDESDGEIEQTMRQLRNVNVRILTIGQYLQPSKNHAPVTKYIEPDRFEQLTQIGKSMGFDYVAAGPLVRTSYRAAEAFVKSAIGKSV